MPNRKLAVSRAIVLLIALSIIAGSSVPGNNIPHILKFTPDKLIHCLEYGVLAIFIFRWLRLEFTTLSTGKISILTLLLGSLMGVVDENYQRLIPGRYPDFWDWVLDSIGVLLAIFLMNYFLNRGQKTPQ